MEIQVLSCSLNCEGKKNRHLQEDGEAEVRLTNKIIEQVSSNNGRKLISRVSPKALERLEPYMMKVTRTVLRRACELVTVLWGGNTPRLSDYAKTEFK